MQIQLNALKMMKSIAKSGHSTLEGTIGPSIFVVVVF